MTKDYSVFTEIMKGVAARMSPEERAAAASYYEGFGNGIMSGMMLVGRKNMTEDTYDTLNTLVGIMDAKRAGFLAEQPEVEAQA